MFFSSLTTRRPSKEHKTALTLHLIIREKDFSFSFLACRKFSVAICALKAQDHRDQPTNID